MTPNDAKPEHRCSDIRDTCVVGSALRRGAPLLTAVAEALDAILYRGIRPTIRPLTRAEASEQLLALHCGTHRPEAEVLLATLSPGIGIPGRPRSRRTPPPTSVEA